MKPPNKSTGSDVVRFQKGPASCLTHVMKILVYKVALQHKFDGYIGLHREHVNTHFRPENRIAGVMVGVLALSVVDRGF